MSEISKLQDRLIAAQEALIFKDEKIKNLEISVDSLQREISENQFKSDRAQISDSQFQENLALHFPGKLEISRLHEYSSLESDQLRVRTAAAEAAANFLKEELEAEVARRRKAETDLLEISCQLTKIKNLSTSRVEEELKQLRIAAAALR